MTCTTDTPPATSASTSRTGTAGVGPSTQHTASRCPSAPCLAQDSHRSCVEPWSPLACSVAMTSVEPFRAAISIVRSPSRRLPINAGRQTRAKYCFVLSHEICLPFKSLAIHAYAASMCNGSSRKRAARLNAFTLGLCRWRGTSSARPICIENQERAPRRSCRGVVL